MLLSLAVGANAAKTRTWSEGRPMREGLPPSPFTLTMCRVCSTKLEEHGGEMLAQIQEV